MLENGRCGEGLRIEKASERLYRDEGKLRRFWIGRIGPRCLRGAFGFADGSHHQCSRCCAHAVE